MSGLMSFADPDSSGRRYAPVGNYDLLGHVATGGMGVVYKAVDGETGRVVALKILSPTLAAHPVALERFRREAARGLKLRHENLVSVYDFGEAGGLHFLALEWIDGPDLHEYVNRKGRLEPREGVEFLAQAARALDYLYRQRVVHRDVKPSNFMVARADGGAVVKLTDLGLAREVNDDDYRVTRDGHTVGTIDYLSPEQALDPNRADVRSDLYSLGCTLYHMLAGRPPFPDGGLAERVHRHAQAEPPD